LGVYREELDNDIVLHVAGAGVADTVGELEYNSVGWLRKQHIDLLTVPPRSIAMRMPRSLLFSEAILGRCDDDTLG
jgi:hypothetical protein